MKSILNTVSRMMTFRGITEMFTDVYKTYWNTTGVVSKLRIPKLIAGVLRMLAVIFGYPIVTVICLLYSVIALIPAVCALYKACGEPAEDAN